MTEQTWIDYRWQEGQQTFNATTANHPLTPQEIDSLSLVTPIISERLVDFQWKKMD